MNERVLKLITNVAAQMPSTQKDSPDYFVGLVDGRIALARYILNILHEEGDPCMTTDDQ